MQGEQKWKLQSAPFSRIYDISSYFFKKIPLKLISGFMFLSSSYFPHSLRAIVFFSLEIYGKQVLFLHARVSYLFYPSFSTPPTVAFLETY